MKLWKLATAATVLFTSSNANAALIERLGGLAYYDDIADLTWLADANYAQTSGYDADGRMTWVEANNWAASLSLGGVYGWSLADSDTYFGINSDPCFGFNCVSSDMGNLFYNTLGNSAGFLSNTGPFSNIQYEEYWSASEYAALNSGAWYFDMGSGRQSSYSKAIGSYAWAVYGGDISAVPIPSAVWLFGSGLIGLVGFARRKKA